MIGMDLAVLVHTLAWTLLHFIWQGCVLVAAFALTTLALRRAHPNCRYLAGCLTLLMMAVAPLATFTWLCSHTDRTVERMFATGTTPGVILAPSSLGLNQKLLCVVIVWLIGAAACVVWVIGGCLQARRLCRIDAVPPSHPVQSMIDALSRRLGVAAALRIVDHAVIVVPMTLGVVKPIIFIPASMLTNLSPAHLEAIIAHEMAHVRRLDYLINLMQALLEAMLFYHPAVWWVSRRVRQEREFCCDDIAAEICGNRITYARALAELESLRGDSLRLGLSSQGGSLMKRIIRLVGQDIGGAGVRSDWPSRVVASLAGVALLTAASATFALAQTSRPVTTPPSDAQIDAQTLARMAATEAYVRAVQGQVEASTVEEQVALHLHEMLADEVLLEVTPEMHEVWMATEDGAEESGTAFQALHLRVAAVRTAHIDPAAFDQIHVHAALLPRVAIGGGLRIAVAMLDPEKMPSDGLVRAAQYAYPFDLFTLTPWVDPNAHQVLVLPQVEAVAGEQAESADQSAYGLLLLNARRALVHEPDIAPARRAVERAMVDLQVELVPAAVETDVIIGTVEGGPPAEEPVPAVEEPAPQPPAPPPSPPKP